MPEIIHTIKAALTDPVNFKTPENKVAISWQQRDIYANSLTSWTNKNSRTWNSS